MSPTTHAIAQRLNRDCFCIGTDVPALRRWLENDLRSHGVSQSLVDTHPHLLAAAPVFVARKQAEQMRDIIEAVETVVALPSYREAVLSDAPTIACAAPPALGVFLGYDFHQTDAGPKLIEINTNAGGAMLNAALRRGQRACCVDVERFARGQNDAGDLEEMFFRMFLQEWRRARGDVPLSSIAIVDDAPEAQYLYPEFLLFQRLFESRGIASIIAAAGQLEYESGAIWHAGQRIDMIYNRVTDFYFEDPGHETLSEAYRADAVVVTPHPHAHAVYGNKRNLALLTNEQELRAMQVAERSIELLLGGIPQTLVVSAGGDKRWWSERKQWFFKPARGFGSRGSYRGDKLTRGTFAAALKGDYVAQRLVPPSERWLGDEPRNRALKLDLRNYVYARETQLIAARLYQGQTTNFRTPGGGFAPIYLI
jgi:hypothetical protein